MFRWPLRKLKEIPRDERDPRWPAVSVRVYRSGLRCGRSMVGIATRDRSFGPSDILGRNPIQRQAVGDPMEPAELAPARLYRGRHRSTCFSLATQSISLASGIAEARRVFYYIFPDCAGVPGASRSCEAGLVPDFSWFHGRFVRNHPALHFGGNDLLVSSASRRRQRLW